MQRIAVLNSGGDSPGMNAAVASVARSAALKKIRLVGIIRGYNGIIRTDETLLADFFDNAKKVAKDNESDLQLVAQIEQAIRNEADGIMPDMKLLLEKYRTKLALANSIEEFLTKYSAYDDDFEDLDLETILDINNMPGTYLRTARCDDFRKAYVRMRGVVNLVAAGIEGLVVIGGDGSFQGATLLCEMGIPCIGIPGTIDNDLAYTEMTLGYDTAVNVCMRSVLEIRATSRSHDRPHVVEVMGRDCGDIAIRTAMATGSEIVVVREVPWSVDEVASRMQKLIDNGNKRVTVIISEGAYATMQPFNLYEFLGKEYERDNRSLPPEKHKRIWHEEPMTAHRLAEVLSYKCTMKLNRNDKAGTHIEARSTVIGYTQRGDAPSAYDAVFAYKAGIEAVRLLVRNESNRVIGIEKGRVYSLSIQQAFEMQRKTGKKDGASSQTDVDPHTLRLVNQVNSISI